MDESFLCKCFLEVNLAARVILGFKDRLGGRGISNMFIELSGGITEPSKEVRKFSGILERETG